MRNVGVSLRDFVRRFCFCCCMAWSTIRKKSHRPHGRFSSQYFFFSLYFNRSIDETKLKVLGFCFFIHIFRRKKMRPDRSLLLMFRTSHDFNHLGCIESDIQNPGISYQPQLIITKVSSPSPSPSPSSSSSSSSSSS